MISVSNEVKTNFSNLAMAGLIRKSVTNNRALFGMPLSVYARFPGTLLVSEKLSRRLMGNLQQPMLIFDKEVLTASSYIGLIDGRIYFPVVFDRYGFCDCCGG